MTLRWQIEDIDGGLRMARGGRWRMDICVRTRLPEAPMARLARAVRQDLWRTLRRLRGFSPVIEVQRAGASLDLRAGGMVDGRVPPGAEALVRDLLEDSPRRARWVYYARQRAS